MICKCGIISWLTWIYHVCISLYALYSLKRKASATSVLWEGFTLKQCSGHMRPVVRWGLTLPKRGIHQPGNIWCHYGLYSKRKTWCFTFLLLKSKHECSKSGELHICTCLLKNPVGVWEYMQPLSIGRRESPITIKREHSASFDGCPICTRSKVLFFTFAKALG